MGNLGAGARGPRADAAFALPLSLRAPWSLEVAEAATLTVVVQQAGSAVLTFHGNAPLRLQAGDAALIRGPVRYVLSHEEGESPHVLIGPRQECSGAPGWGPGPHGTWGNGGGEDRLLVGTWQLGSPAQHEAVLLRRADLQIAALVESLAAQAGPFEGGSVVVDRALDLLLAQLMEAEVPDGGAEGAGVGAGRARVGSVLGRGDEAGDEPGDTGDVLGSILGLGDPMVDGVLDAVWQEPGRKWSVSEMAQGAGLSRSALGRRVLRASGCTPQEYLQRARIHAARQLLLESELPLDAIAARVGYSTGFALSAAYKRVVGESPAQTRARLGNGRASGGAAQRWR